MRDKGLGKGMGGQGNENQDPSSLTLSGFSGVDNSPPFYSLALPCFFLALPVPCETFGFRTFC